MRRYSSTYVLLRVMKTAVKPDSRIKTFYINKNYAHVRVKKTSLFDSRFYQKLFVYLISFSTILIFPESPRELENICESYNAGKICNVW